jgi:hypothetical protein
MVGFKADGCNISLEGLDGVELGVGTVLGWHMWIVVFSELVDPCAL